MTERIIDKLYRMNEQMGLMNETLSAIEKKMSKTEVNEITQMGDWMLQNASMDNPQDENIIVTVYVASPRAQKIYRTTLNNIYTLTKDYVVILDDKSDKVEMINKDYVYQIIIDVAEETK
jgi:hypothetical protein